MAVFSCIFLFFCKKRETRRARPQARARNKKPGAACRPGFWRSFGEYIFLEDSRYASQAENRAAVKSFNRHRKSAPPCDSAAPKSTRSRPASGPPACCKRPPVARLSTHVYVDMNFLAETA